jgi:flagella basal body P-ring formation protein FlgA
MKRFVLTLFVFPLPLLAGCQLVTGSRILGSDLARADSRFAALPATLIAGFTPTPGTSRTIPAADLGRLAKANGLPLTDPHDLCFEFPMQQVTAEAILAAMQKAIGPEAEVRLLEFPKTLLPEGKLDFSLAGIEPASNGVQFWRGSVNYAENRRAPLITRVAIAIAYTVVIATADLLPNTRIEPGSLQLEKRAGPFVPNANVASLKAIEGRAVTRPVRTGEPIPLSIVAIAPDVHRGDAVRVEVHSGRARLHFDALAESSARTGEFVELRNPLNGKTFKARLTAPSQAVLIVGNQTL